MKVGIEKILEGRNKKLSPYGSDIKTKTRNVYDWHKERDIGKLFLEGQRLKNFTQNLNKKAGETNRVWIIVDL